MKKGAIPLSIQADLAVVLPTFTLTKGATIRVNEAVRAGVPTDVVSRTLFAAGAQAQLEGRSKIGPIGSTQRTIFDRLTHHTRIAAGNKIRGL